MEKPVKISFLIALGLLTLVSVVRPSAFGLLDNANLLFHEAGHVFFGLLGETLGMWGGTLFQLLLPTGIAIAFLKKRDFYGAAIMFYWVGENFLHIAPYIKDARAMALPLVGGGIHDWNYILTHLGLLSYDQVVGNLTHAVGISIMLASITFGFRSIKRETLASDFKR